MPRLLENMRHGCIATELAEARRAFGFFDPLEQCIAAEGSQRKSRREKTSAIPEPVRYEIHWGKLAYKFRGTALGIFLTSISIKRTSTGS